jgi:hypothetical protein
MQRLCGRPGCSDVASVAYGMRAEDLVFWIDAMPEPLEDGAAVLCLRHADSMVVPRGWTLDDLRDPDLHLFRPPLPAPTTRTRAARAPRDPVVAEQLRLDAEPEPPGILHDDSSPATDADRDDAGVDPDPWTPSFDEADDLGGLLSARSPLLSRAFRTADRQPD